MCFSLWLRFDEDALGDDDDVFACVYRGSFMFMFVFAGISSILCYKPYSEHSVQNVHIKMTWYPFYPTSFPLRYFESHILIPTSNSISIWWFVCVCVCEAHMPECCVVLCCIEWHNVNMFCLRVALILSMWKRKHRKNKCMWRFLHLFSITISVCRFAVAYFPFSMVYVYYHTRRLFRLFEFTWNWIVWISRSFGLRLISKNVPLTVEIVARFTGIIEI